MSRAKENLGNVEPLLMHVFILFRVCLSYPGGLHNNLLGNVYICAHFQVVQLSALTTHNMDGKMNWEKRKKEKKIL